MPEAELRAYLRVFLPEEDIEPALDSIALMGIEIEADDPLELFVLAHLEVERDPRVSVEMEAIVLREEVGLTAIEVSAILDLTEAQVAAAVAQAWEAAESGVEAEPEEAPPEPRSEPEGPAEPLELRSDAEVQVEPTPPEPISAPEGPPEPLELRSDPEVQVEPEEAGSAVLVAPPKRQWSGIIGAGALAAGVLVVAGLSLSTNGVARLTFQGINPLVWLGVLSGFIVVGAALLRAGSSAKPLDKAAASPDPATPQPARAAAGETPESSTEPSSASAQQ